MVSKEAIHEVINGKDLSYEMAQGAMKEIMHPRNRWQPISRHFV